jgi:hypothetical protein
MRTRIFAVSAIAILATVTVLLYQTRVRAQVPMPNQMRFQMIGDEPIVSPDGRSYVTNWKAMMLRDRQADRCYIAILADKSLALNGPVDCPR